jgi:hypothetical protein
MGKVFPLIANSAILNKICTDQINLFDIMLYLLRVRLVFSKGKVYFGPIPPGFVSTIICPN